MQWLDQIPHNDYGYECNRYLLYLRIYSTLHNRLEFAYVVVTISFAASDLDKIDV